MTLNFPDLIVGKSLRNIGKICFTSAYCSKASIMSFGVVPGGTNATVAVTRRTR